PLGIPMIAGPGAITNAIVLMEDASDIQHKLVLILSVVITLVLTLVLYQSASRVTRFMGETGNKIMLKLMGLIVMVIAVEFFLAGIKPIIRDILGIAG
ncbi:MAG: antibiotic resistance protein MarC, partial [Bacteroidales bacterium]|nr:antibiotic resistance protein MarC [Bacteroidales bacterium]